VGAYCIVPRWEFSLHENAVLSLRGFSLRENTVLSLRGFSLRENCVRTLKALFHNQRMRSFLRFPSNDLTEAGYKITS
jgi:hypothetical protein